MRNTSSQRLLHPAEVAEQLGVPIATLYAWNYRKVGPRSFRVGRHLRYRQADVDAWLESCGRRESRTQ